MDGPGQDWPGDQSRPPQGQLSVSGRAQRRGCSLPGTRHRDQGPPPAHGTGVRNQSGRVGRGPAAPADASVTVTRRDPCASTHPPPPTAARARVQPRVWAMPLYSPPSGPMSPYDPPSGTLTTRPPGPCASTARRQAPGFPSTTTTRRGPLPQYDPPAPRQSYNHPSGPIRQYCAPAPEYAVQYARDGVADLLDQLGRERKARDGRLGAAGEPDPLDGQPQLPI